MNADLEAMVREACEIEPCDSLYSIAWVLTCEGVELLANRVAAKEREACAKICDSVDNYANPMTASDCADAIRGRQ